MDIKENMSIRKVFSLGKNEQINASECGLVLPVTGSGSFTLFVNNKRIEFPAESGKGIIFNRESGNIPIEIETKDDGSKTITVNMTFCNVTGENMICFDRYRDYGRTFLDGKVLPCELALRILLPLKK